MHILNLHLPYLIGCTGIRNIRVALKNRGDISSAFVNMADLSEYEQRGVKTSDTMIKSNRNNEKIKSYHNELRISRK